MVLTQIPTDVVKCREPLLRRRAIEVLKRCNFQEGAWDGQTMVVLVQSIVQAEERDVCNPQHASDIPEHNRLYRAWYELMEVPNRALHCKRRCFEVDGDWIDYVEYLG